MQKNEEYILTINNLGANGEGVGIIDNFPVFIPLALCGEKVKIKIVKVLKNFAYGKLLQVLLPSSNRVEPRCPVFNRCGGCQLQHLRYDEQLKFKTNLVQNNLLKFGNIVAKVESTEPSPKQYEYRNKIQIPITQIESKIGDDTSKNESKIVTGFYSENSHCIVPTLSCVLHGKWAEELLCIVPKYIKQVGESCYNESTKKGNIRHIVARVVDDKIMIVLVTKTNTLKSSNLLIDILKQKFDKFSLYQNINPKDTNVILGEKFILLYGEKTLKTVNFGISYEISPHSFMQVNTDIQNKIYQKVLDSVDENSILIDAYSGAGLLTSILSKKAKKVYGIEIVPQATENANKLIKENKIKNVININGDCSVELPKLVDKLSNEDKANLCIILDPPRKGCDEKVLKNITSVLPNKIIYISCNSATLSRDLKFLTGENYHIDLIKPYDMFPQTKNVETLAILTKNDYKNKIGQ